MQGRSPLVGALGHQHLDTQGLGPGLDHFNRLGVAGARHHKHPALAFHRAHRQRHRLGGGGGFIQHRCVGDVHAGEVGHQGLEVHQCLHAALRNLGLVRRVGGVPGRVLQHVAQDHTRGVRAVIALADEALEHLVLRGDGLELGQRGGFGDGWRQLHGAAPRDAARHDGVDQGAARGLTDDRQHQRFVGLADADVAGNELAGVFEFIQGFYRGHQHGGNFQTVRPEPVEGRRTEKTCKGFDKLSPNGNRDQAAENAA